MRGAAWAVAAAAVLALAASERRTDTDFEFDDAPDSQTARLRRPRRYIYDPQSPLCRELVCKKREVCLMRDAFTAQCASKKEVLRRGDTIVAARRERVDGDDDVFYEEARGPDLETEEKPPRAARRPERLTDRSPERCVGCGADAAGGDGGDDAQFVCGSDNRTYSSLCRLDLHNCVRRATVRLACRGFCPCRAPPALPARFQQRGAGGGASGAMRRGARGPSGCELDEMADRLLDWFSVLMEEAGGAPPASLGFPRDCKPEVRWMFAHLDAAADGLLSRDDLYALRHDERERCLRPFLATCARGAAGRGAGRAAGRAARGLTRAAWCGCLRRAARPCAALARAHPNPSPGAYVPACDARGFYRPRQCHAALGVCWCVDAHGVERPASRTKGQPACPEEREALSEGAEAKASGPADDEDEPGSGDNELHF